MGFAEEAIPASEDAKLEGIAEVGITTAGMLLESVALETRLPKDEARPLGMAETGRVKAGAPLLSVGIADEAMLASDEARPDGMAVVVITTPGAPLPRVADEIKLPRDDARPLGTAEAGRVRAES